MNRLLEVGGGRWTVVDAAMRFRPPASTEQVIHPDKYLPSSSRDRVSRARRPALGWKRRVVRARRWASG